MNEIESTIEKSSQVSEAASETPPIVTANPLPIEPPLVVLPVPPAPKASPEPPEPPLIAPPVPPELKASPEPPEAPKNSNGWKCPECGKDGYKYRSFLIHKHIRTAHADKAEEIEKRLAPGPASPFKPRQRIYPEGAQPISEPPPDFTDIDPGQRQPETAQAPVIKVVNYRQLGEMSFDMGTGLLSRIFGPEWQATSKEERDAMVEAFRVYYESKQLPDLPPGYMLVMMCAIYSAPRLAQPATRGKLQLLWAWVKVKVFRRKPQQLKIVTP